METPKWRIEVRTDGGIRAQNGMREQGKGQDVTQRIYSLKFARELRSAEQTANIASFSNGRNSEPSSNSTFRMILDALR
jgi:hypothetical protein